MIVIPEIYAKNGKAVALDQTSTPFFNEDILKFAGNLKDTGCTTLFINDMNIPASGQSQNYKLLLEVKQKLEMDVIVSGGFKSVSSTMEYINKGLASLLVFGTFAYQEPKILKECSDKAPGKLAVSIEVKGTRVIIPGWTVSANKSALDYVEGFKKTGIKFFVYSEHNDQGKLDDNIINNIKEFCLSAYSRIILRVNFSNINEIEKIISADIPKLDGIVISHSFYRGTIDLKSVNTLIAELESQMSTEPTMTEM